MQVKSIAEHSAILLTFIKLPFVIKTFILSIFEWPLKTGFTVSFNMHAHPNDYSRRGNPQFLKNPTFLGVVLSSESWP